MGKASQTSGVKPMAIAGRLVVERERLLGMTEAERAWRAKWLKDQLLAPSEPRNVPEMYKATHNPIRRAYRWPLDQLQKVIEPSLGAQRALTIRYLTGKAFLGLAGIYYIAYYFKYNQNTWMGKAGWKVFESRKAVVAGDPGYPKLSDRSAPEDYASRGFKDFKVNL